MRSFVLDIHRLLEATAGSGSFDSEPADASLEAFDPGCRARFIGLERERALLILSPRTEFGQIQRL